MKVLLCDYDLSSFLLVYATKLQMDPRAHAIQSQIKAGVINETLSFWGATIPDSMVRSMSVREFSQTKASVKLLFDDINFFEPDVDQLNNYHPMVIRFIQTHFQLSHDSSCDCLISKDTRYSLYKDLVRLGACTNDHLDEIYSILSPANMLSDTSNESDFLLLSPDALLNDTYNKICHKLTPERISAILATAGITISLPSIFCPNDETISIMKKEYEEERMLFLDYFRGFIQNCFEGIQSGLYKDVWEYASFATNNELQVSINKFESAVKKSDKSLLKRIKVGIVNGIPEIVQSLIDPKKNSMNTIGIELLKVLCQSITEKAQYKLAAEKFPSASYVYKIKTDTHSRQ